MLRPPPPPNPSPYTTLFRSLDTDHAQELGAGRHGRLDPRGVVDDRVHIPLEVPTLHGLTQPWAGAPDRTRTPTSGIGFLSTGGIRLRASGVDDLVPRQGEPVTVSHQIFANLAMRSETL